MVAMKWWIVLIFLLVKTCGTFSKLQCSVNNEVVSIQLNVSSIPAIQKDGDYTVYTIRLGNHKESHPEPGCFFNNIGNLNCSIWGSDKHWTPHEFINEYITYNYTVEVIDTNNKKVVWKRTIGNLLDDFLFNCFDDHAIKDLKIATTVMGKQYSGS